MSRRRRQRAGDSFWVGYADLMTSLFFVFLVVSTTLAVGFQIQNAGLIREAEKARRIEAITQVIQRVTDRGNFEFRPECNRFELTYEFEFAPNSYVLPEGAKPELVEAGRDIARLLAQIPDSSDVKVKVVVEGRAAKNSGGEAANGDTRGYVKELSYRRALAVATLWDERGVRFDPRVSERYVAGSGFGGDCRYSGREEGKNKRIIVQLVPFLVGE